MRLPTEAIVCRNTYGNGGWRLEQVDVREPGPGELLVQMVATGVCHTDISVGSLPAGSSPIAIYPRVLGHEGTVKCITIFCLFDHADVFGTGSGYVKEVGPGVTRARPGDPVLLSFSSCHECEICTAGHYANCLEQRKLFFEGMQQVFAAKNPHEEINGGFFGQSSFANLSIVREQSVVNVEHLVRSKEELQLLSPLGCGIQTGSATVLNVAHASRKDVICIIGLGGVGLAALMTARIKECRKIIGIDRIASRLDLATELGATEVIDSSKLVHDEELKGAVRQATNGIGPTITIDTTGVPQLIEAGLDWTRNRGQYIQVGSPPFDFKLAIDVYGLMEAGKQFVGAVQGQAYPQEYLPLMIQWYRDGLLPMEKLVKRYPVSQFEKAQEEMRSGDAVKPVLCW